MNALEEYLKGYVGGVKSLLVGMRTSMTVSYTHLTLPTIA